ncbi:predicted protein [Enterococcus gallinarum EG2]|nr:predicted protein [Enterococcus gallinarum EG2]
MCKIHSFHSFKSKNSIPNFRRKSLQMWSKLLNFLEFATMDREERRRHKHGIR